MQNLPGTVRTPPPSSTLATVSLVFGLLCWVAVPVIGSLVAIVCGHMARAEIRRAAGRLGGDGMAVAGLVLGYVHLATAVVALVVALLFFGGIAALLTVIGLHAAVSG